MSSRFSVALRLLSPFLLGFPWTVGSARLEPPAPCASASLLGGPPQVLSPARGQPRAGAWIRACAGAQGGRAQGSRQQALQGQPEQDSFTVEGGRFPSPPATKGPTPPEPSPDLLARPQTWEGTGVSLLSWRAPSQAGAQAGPALSHTHPAPLHPPDSSHHAGPGPTPSDLHLPPCSATLRCAPPTFPGFPHPLLPWTSLLSPPWEASTLGRASEGLPWAPALLPAAPSDGTAQ